MKGRMHEPEDYTFSFVVYSEARKAFDVLSKRIGDWWGEQSRPVKKAGDIFTVSWGEPWYRFKVLDYEPYHKICWECIDANQIIDDLEGVQKEWVGTQLLWTIETRNSGQVEISFRHKGLVPEFICYDFCSSTWNQFLANNLKTLLEN